MKNAPRIHAMATKLLRDQEKAVELALRVLIAAGADMTRVCIKTVRGADDWPSFPGVDVLDAKGVAARIRWVRCTADEHKWHLSLRMRDDLEGGEVVS